MASTEELEAAAGSIRGDFLADLSLERGFEYEAWRAGMASEVEIVELGILRELVERLDGEPRRATPLARRLRRLLPEDIGLAEEIEALEEKVRAAAAQPTARTPRRRRNSPEKAPQPPRTPDAPSISAGLSMARGLLLPRPAAARPSFAPRIGCRISPSTGTARSGGT